MTVFEDLNDEMDNGIGEANDNYNKLPAALLSQIESVNLTEASTMVRNAVAAAEQIVATNIEQLPSGPQNNSSST